MCNLRLRKAEVMEYGSITRRIAIDAPPAVVFDVVSDPRHVSQWWPDEADYEATPGDAGRIVFASPGGDPVVVGFQVVDAAPPRLFSFRWTQEPGEPALQGNSFLVTFEIEPDGDGSVLLMTETGFRERGWDEAAVAEAYREHGEGWDYHLARLGPYIATLSGRDAGAAIAARCQDAP